MSYREEMLRMFDNRAKKRDMPKEGKINTLLELKEFIKRIKPGDHAESSNIIINTKGTSLANDEFSGNVSIPISGGQSTLRKTLIDGFDMIQKHMKYHQESINSQKPLDEYGGFVPAVAPDPNEYSTWVDRFIHNIGGRRDHLTIIWDLPEGSYRLDPYSCKLDKIS